MRKSGRLWLFTPLALAGLIDIVLTLVGQSPEYWAGDYSMTQEGNPFAEPLLAWNPWLFASAGILWLSALGTMVYLWKHRIAFIIAMIAFAGHTFGGAAWMLYLPPNGWIAATVYLLLMIGLWKWCASRANETNSIASEYRRQRNHEPRQ
jgi:hypothetical protein